VLSISVCGLDVGGLGGGIGAKRHLKRSDGVFQLARGDMKTISCFSAKTVITQQLSTSLSANCVPYNHEFQRKINWNTNGSYGKIERCDACLTTKIIFIA